MRYEYGRGWFDESSPVTTQHQHIYVFENLGRDGYETHSCSCGATIRYHVKE